MIIIIIIIIVILIIVQRPRRVTHELYLHLLLPSHQLVIRRVQLKLTTQFTYHIPRYERMQYRVSSKCVIQLRSYCILGMRPANTSINVDVSSAIMRGGGLSSPPCKFLIALINVTSFVDDDGDGDDGTMGLRPMPFLFLSPRHKKRLRKCTM
jgi:hypothetical protein